MHRTKQDVDDLLEMSDTILESSSQLSIEPILVTDTDMVAQFYARIHIAHLTDDEIVSF